MILIVPLFECDSVGYLWVEAPFHVQPMSRGSSFVTWFQHLRTSLEKEAFRVAMVVCWHLWWKRNQIVHGGSLGEVEDIVAWTHNFLEAYIASQFPKVGRTSPVLSLWMAPTGSIIKINFDMGFLHPVHCQIAVIARDADGTCVGWRTRRLMGQPPVVVGETRAALESFIFTLERGSDDVMVEGDNSTVISALQNKLDDLFLSYGAIVRHILRLASSLNSFSSSFIRRSSNGLAHAIAHLHFVDSDVLEDLTLPADLA